MREIVILLAIVGAVFFIANRKIQPQIITQPVERIVEKPVIVEKERVVEKRVEVPVDRIIEKRVEVIKPVEVPKIIEKRIEVPRVVPKIIEAPGRPRRHYPPPRFLRRPPPPCYPFHRRR